ncbi:MAG: hypothetical protein ACWGQW_03090 [bacterium]
MEKAEILQRLDELKAQGHPVGSYVDEMQPKVLMGVLNAALEAISPAEKDKSEGEAETPAEKPKVDKSAKAKAARRKVAQKAVEDKKKAAEAKKKKASGKVTLRSVRDWPSLRTFLNQEDDVLLDTSPTNILDKYLYNSGRGMKVSNAHKKFLDIIADFNEGKKEDDQFKALKTMSSVRSHIRYREENDGWIFNKEGDNDDPKIRLVGMNPEFRGVKVADRPAE